MPIGYVDLIRHSSESQVHQEYTEAFYRFRKLYFSSFLISLLILSTFRNGSLPLTLSKDKSKYLL